ncbi:hypothetical protein, partial [Escherichia coli]|uniref:hypothetical protein n=1 Tax=Escherichia coli TaxID=562 RepID=UPI0025A2905F
MNKERSSSAQIKVKCQELEEELSRKKQEVELWQITSSKNEAKLKQESIDVAAGKLADCQKTIASLNKQLQSLATLEDFLIDTSNLPGFSGPGSLIS